MRYKIHVETIMHPGKRVDEQGSPHQEDSIYPSPGHITDRSRCFVLCDGMGGHHYGEVASSTVCRVLGSELERQRTADADSDEIKKVESAIAAAYRALDEYDSDDDKKMGTTMTLLDLTEKGAVVAHMGDSRVYHIRPGADKDSTSILFQTTDHSLVNDMIRSGVMTKEEARFSGVGNIITRAMQPGANSRQSADINVINDLQPGDFFYLCSDGMLEQEEMDSGEALKNIFSGLVADDATRRRILEGATMENSDNHSAIIVHLLEVDGKRATPAVETASTGEADERRKAALAKQRVYRTGSSSRGSLWLWGIILALVLAALIIGAWFLFADSASNNDVPMPVDVPGAVSAKAGLPCLDTTLKILSSH